MVVNKEKRDPVQAVGQPPDPAAMSNHLPILNPTRPELTRITLAKRHEPGSAFDTVMARRAGKGLGT
ncbi:hypothetical protein [Streptomyces sp. NPDC057579]|uniref:hypothetical protein n=1 Tax=Streptomyces sp. NPDC057579 TaxID=3346172 RepID=UPI0036C5DF37